MIPLLVLLLLLSGCALPQPPRPAPERVALITDGGRVDDGSLNEAVLEGLLQAQEEIGFELDFREPERPDLDLLLETLASRPDLVVLVGQDAVAWVEAMAAEHPESDLLIVDARTSAALANVATISWEESQGVVLGGRLAGALGPGEVAGLLQAPAGEAVGWDAAFRQGVLSTCPACAVTVVPLEQDAPEAEGRMAAEELARRDVAAVFATGGRTAERALLPLAQAEVWVAGGWVDLYRTVFDGGAVAGAHRLFGGVVKDAAPAVRAAVLDWSTGALGSRQGGWAIAPPHDAAEWLPQGAAERLRELLPAD